MPISFILTLLSKLIQLGGQLLGRILSWNIQKQAALGFLWIFLILMMSSGVGLIDYSPINYSDQTMGDLDENQTTVPKSADKGDEVKNVSLGLTYGPKDSWFTAHWWVFALLIPVDALIAVSLLPYMVLLGLGHDLLNSLRSANSSLTKPITEPLLVFALSFGLYLFMTIFMFSMSLPLQYIAPSYDGISFLEALYPFKIHPSFMDMMLMQAVIVSLILTIWARPINPFEDNECIPNYETSLAIHMENWRQYGSWIGTLFGGLIVTSAIVYIVDISPFGAFFVRYVIILFVGATTLILGYISYKLRKLESEIGSISN